MFNLYLQHCTPDMISILNAMNGWESAEVTQDGITLIKMIRSIINKHEDSRQGLMAIFQSENHIFLTYTNPDTPNTEYLNQLKACVDVIKT